jgi:hypothetical protein
VAALSEAWICGRWPAEIVGMEFILLWVSCDVRQMSLRWADNSHRGVLPIVVCLSVIMNHR